MSQGKDQAGRYAMSRRRRLHSCENSILIMPENLAEQDRFVNPETTTAIAHPHAKG